MRILIIGLGVIALIIVALLVIPSFVPVDAYKDRLIQAVDAKTGHHLSVEGKMSLSLLPRIELVARKVSLGPAAGTGSNSMASFDEMDVAVKLLPLLGGNLAVDQLVLVNPSIALEVDASGRPNWQVTGGAAPSPSPGPAAPAQSASHAFGVLSLGDVHLVNGTIAYVDKRSGGHLTFEKINIRAHLADPAAPFSLNGDFLFDQTPVTVSLNADQLQSMLQGAPTPVRATLKSDKLSLSFDGRMTGGAEPSAEGKVDVKVPSAAHFLAWVNQQPAPATDGLGNLSITGAIATKGRVVTFTNADITLDKMTAKGQIAFDAGVKPAKLTGRLAISEIDLNPYLAADRKAAPASAAPTQAKGATTESGWSDAPIDAGGLKALDADMSITLAGFKLKKLSVDASNVDIALAAGKLTVDLKQMALYDGKGSARLVIDGASQHIAAQLHATLSGVALDAFLRDAIDLDRVTGKGAIEADLTTQGRNQKDLAAGLSGKGDFHFTDGAIKGLDLAGLLRQAGGVKSVADLPGLVQSLGSNPDQQKTDFTTCSASFQVANGIARNEDFLLAAPSFRADGAGTVDLPARKVDYRLTPRASADKSGFAVPILVAGTFDHLTYRPDLKAALTESGNVQKVLQNLIRH